MKKAMVFLAATVVALPVFADDLLDEVLRWDKPSAKPKAERTAPAEVPTITITEEKPKSQDNIREERLWRRLEAAEKRAAEAEEALARKEASWEDNDWQEDNTKTRDDLPDEKELTGAMLSGRAGKRGEDFAISLEGMVPCGKMPFDLAARGFHLDCEEANGKNSGGEIWLAWHPFRGAEWGPYAGLGGKYERFRRERASDSGHSYSLAGRAGLWWRSTNWERLSARVEVAIGKESNEVVAEGWCRLFGGFNIGVFLERFGVDTGNSVVLGAGGALQF